MIHSSLADLTVPLTDLTLLPGNPRRGDVDAVVRSYSVFGQRKPIVARRTGSRDGRPVGIVIAGNHQLAAAEKLGWSEIAAVWTDDDEMTAKAFALADNRTSELGVFDEEALADMLGDVTADGSLLAAASYSEQDLLDLVARTGGPTMGSLADLDDDSGGGPCGNLTIVCERESMEELRGRLRDVSRAAPPEHLAPMGWALEQVLTMFERSSSETSTLASSTV